MRAAWPLCLLLALAACGDRTATSGSAAPTAGAATASIEPWDAPSQAGLWRHVTMEDGRPAASVLTCYAPSMGSLVPRSAAHRGLRCEGAERRRVAGGWVREERCTTVPGDEGRRVRATLSGDMAAAFSVTTVVLNGDGGTRENESTVVDTWLRMGECPEGLSPGQSRPDGTPLIDTPRLAEPGAAPARPRPSAAAGPSSDPIGDLVSPGATPPEEVPPSEEVPPTPPPAAPAAPPPTPPAPTGT